MGSPGAITNHLLRSNRRTSPQTDSLTVANLTLEDRPAGRTRTRKPENLITTKIILSLTKRIHAIDDGALNERLWVVQDANFNVTAVVDDSGEVVERYIYDPFGQATVLDAEWNVRSGGSAYDWLYLHQGGRYDVTSGLYHFRFRDYSPPSAAGRASTPSPTPPEMGTCTAHWVIDRLRGLI